jgi:hypothetical protein
MHLFQKTILSDTPASIPAILLKDYEAILLANLDALIARYENDPNYQLIDTKLNLITGEDFTRATSSRNDFKSRTCVFGWIQGRGLEALVGHARWLPTCSIQAADEKEVRLRSLDRMIREIFAKLEGFRQKTHGHLFFTMSPDGDAFKIDAEGRKIPVDLQGAPSNFSDLFYVKGLLAAAVYLQDETKIAEAKTYFREIVCDLENGRFRSDQFSFDPKNQVAPIPGKYPQGPRMIALGGLALFTQLLQEPEWIDKGFDFIDHILSRHVNLEGREGFQAYDFWEAVDEAGRPWQENGAILSDPGHALEFVGLAARFLLAIGETSLLSESQQCSLEAYRRILPEILARNFQNGFQPVGGICKSFDLVSRQPLNRDMPWWSLPETMRAAAKLLVFAPRTSLQSREILAKCSNAFFRNFVNPEVHLMAYQTVAVTGRPADVIPATPDADPGYHTGLSMIDMLKCLGY